MLPAHLQSWLNRFALCISKRVCRITPRRINTQIRRRRRRPPLLSRGSPLWTTLFLLFIRSFNLLILLLPRSMFRILPLLPFLRLPLLDALWLAVSLANLTHSGPIQSRSSISIPTRKRSFLGSPHCRHVLMYSNIVYANRIKRNPMPASNCCIGTLWYKRNISGKHKRSADHRLM